MVRCFSRLVYIELQCTLETSLLKLPLCFFVLSSKNKHCPADIYGISSKKNVDNASCGTFLNRSGFMLRYEEQVRREHTDGASRTAAATYVRQALRCGTVSGDCSA